ncbi:amino acid/polyamine/organocation transporter (APC superfamily) [Nocardioides albertanoniae]|uniref:Amino acid/polyamine/organocation transporter (APC superfamily) n=1 Tax=Nocardioides albertanoniae TaxID=1175486 RepID=A0A543A464_9ACTN|nr:amino acid permease [Nocardioides albertanoniae]TQL67372.1 amino acid/polyamine/organocation transporter (APC superfamily) [Nocardioides albertanoniae]
MSDQEPSRLAPPPRVVGEDEDARLAEFGYDQKLDRSVGKIASFAIGFSTISATTAVFTGFGAGYLNAGSPFIWTLFLAIPVFLLWTLIAADLAAKIPLAGYAYQWTSRLNGSSYGWFTGSAALVGWVSGMTSLGYIFAGYLGSVLGWQLTQPKQILIAIFVVTTCVLINAYRVRLATFINNIGVALELVVTVGVTLVVAVVAFVVPGNSQPLSSLFDGTSAGDGPYLLAWLAASLGPFFGLVGVEAVADVAEETKGARRVIPRTMFYAFATSCVIEFLMYLVYVLAIKDASTLTDSAAPIEEIITQQVGPVASRIVVAIALTNILVCLLANVLVGTRLLYSLSRDNMMPFSRALRRVSPARKTPATAVLSLGAVSVLMLLSALVNEQAFNYFLGIATLAFFTTYLLQTVGLLIAAKRGRIPEPERGTFDLGRARTPVLVMSLIVFGVVEAALLFLPAFAGNGFVLAGILGLAVVWWLVVLRGRLRQGQAGPRYAQDHPDETVAVNV